MELVNMTPHPLHIVVGDVTLDVPPSGELARCHEVMVPRGTITVEGVEIPLIAKKFGAVQVPPPRPGTIYVVSALAAQAAWALGRTDVVCPGDPVRDHQGQIVGVRALCVAP